MKKFTHLCSWLLFFFTIIAAGLPESSYAGGNQCVSVPQYQYGGRAFALDVDLNLLIGGNVHLGPISDTGQLSASGGMLESQLLSINTSSPIAVTASILDAAVAGSGDMSVAFANVVGLNLNVANTLEVTAGVLQATAKEKNSGACPNVGVNNAGTGSTIVDLAIKVAGTPVTVDVNAAPNTTVVLPGLATIVVNEQYQANGRQIVNALHITLTAIAANAEVIVSHAEANLYFAGCSCTSATCPVKDFVTGGGYITLPSGAKGSFGFVGGQKANGLQGHLNYIDHGTGQHVQGATVTNYLIPSATSTQRLVQYGCAIDGSNYLCLLDVSDNGEPGANVDRLSISSPVYNASGPTITKGNIQLHKPQGCGTTKKGK